MQKPSLLNRALPVVGDTHVPVGSLVTVTIGRNVGDEPMSGNDWHDFKALVYFFAENLGGQVFGPFDGTGEWDGVSEDSSVLTIITGRPDSIDRIDKALGKCAEVFHQDAIAWSYGPARLARP